MYQPQAYIVVLLLMITSMLCWGSWANTRKLTIGYAFSLFYWDYVIGIIFGSLVWGLTLGSFHGGATAFLANLSRADRTNWLLAIAGGIIFNLANLLLVAAIDLAGMASPFPSASAWLLSSELFSTTSFNQPEILSSSLEESRWSPSRFCSTPSPIAGAKRETASAPEA